MMLSCCLWWILLLLLAESGWAFLRLGHDHHGSSSQRRRSATAVAAAETPPPISYELFVAIQNSGLTTNAEFLTHARDMALAMAPVAHFTPHFFLFRGNHNCSSSVEDPNNACADNDDSLCLHHGRYCAAAPNDDESFRWAGTGREWLIETERRLCLWRHYNSNDGVTTNYWDYLAAVEPRCTAEAQALGKHNPASLTLADCSQQAQEDAGVDLDIIQQCIANASRNHSLDDDGPDPILEAELERQEAYNVQTLNVFYVRGQSIYPQQGSAAGTFEGALDAICDWYVAQQSDVPEQCQCAPQNIAADRDVLTCLQEANAVASSSSSSSTPATQIQSTEAAATIQVTQTQSTAAATTITPTPTIPATQSQTETPQSEPKDLYELWRIMDDATAPITLEHFKNVTTAMWPMATFVPHHAVYDGRLHNWTEYQNPSTHCINHGRYCAGLPNDDNSDYRFYLYAVPGAKWAEESLRRICIWQHYGTGSENNKYWDYEISFNHYCTCNNPDEFGGWCRDQATDAVGINDTLIQQCINDSGGFTEDVNNTLMEDLLKRQHEIEAADGKGELYRNAIYLNGQQIPYPSTMEHAYMAMCNGTTTSAKHPLCNCVSSIDGTVDLDCAKNGGTISTATTTVPPTQPKPRPATTFMFFTAATAEATIEIKPPSSLQPTPAPFDTGDDYISSNNNDDSTSSTWWADGNFRISDQMFVVAVVLVVVVFAVVLWNRRRQWSRRRRYGLPQGDDDDDDAWMGSELELSLELS